MKRIYRRLWVEIRYNAGYNRSGAWMSGSACGAFGLLFNKSAFWMGLHYSKHNKRICINIIPCLTVWATLPGGQEP